DAAAMDDAARHDLDRHLASCTPCRLAFEEQRHVAAILRARAEAPVAAGFSARVGARIDRREAGTMDWLGIANWRAWTAGLAPVAAALLLGVYLGVGAGTTTVSKDAAVDDPQTFE